MIKLIITILFIIWIIVSHEIIHYLVARYYNLNARFKIEKNKKIENWFLRLINLGLPFPAVEIKNIESYKQLNYTLLAPLPFGIVNCFLMCVFATAKPVMNMPIDTWLLWILDISLICAVIISSGDLFILHKYQRIRRNIKAWFENNI